MRIMALDFGEKTVGVAMSDPMLMTASPCEVIRRERATKLRQTLARIGELTEEYRVDRIVLGLPRNMDDSESERTALTRDFGDRVERRTGVPVIYQDERLTTIAAEELMDDMEMSFREKKEKVDMFAACVILREYLNGMNDK